MAHPKHAEVRLRHQCCCGYCGVSETDSGGELTVDHFYPVTAGGNDSDENLIYSCFRCNTYKGEFFPNVEDIRAGRRVLHPLLDDTATHFQENHQSGLLEPLTETGCFHIELLRLNRPQLQEQRLRRQLVRLLTETNQLLLSENKGLRSRIINLETYLEQIRLRLSEESKQEKS